MYKTNINKIERRNDTNIKTVRDFSALHSIMDKASRQKINKETKHLKNTVDQMALTDIYRTFHTTTIKYTFFSSLSIFKIKIMQSIFSYHSGVKLELSSRSKTRKFTTIWKFIYS